MKVDNTCSILPDYEQNSHCESIMEKKEVESEDHKIKILKKKVLKLQRVGLKSVYQETEVYESNHADFKEIKMGIRYRNEWIELGWQDHLVMS